MSDPVTPFELGRMMLGEQSALFYLEIIFRTTIIYVYTFALLRFFGRRTKSQLSLMDVIVVVALGSAVGDVAFYPQVPLLHCLLVVTLIVGFNKAIVQLTQSNKRIRQLVEGEPTKVVEDGVIQMQKLESTSLGLRALLELLRLKGVSNLGQLDLVILEPSCQLSLYKKDEPVAGLSILPEDDGDIDAVEAHQSDNRCCKSCGARREDDGNACLNSGCRDSAVQMRTMPRFAA